MEKDGFSWWVCRIQRATDLFDEFRIDHFRGFAGFWAVPSEEKIAILGRWKVGPGKPLFDAILQAVGKINIIAEDLGVITEDVVQLRKSIEAPGMAVLQFGIISSAVLIKCVQKVALSLSGILGINLFFPVSFSIWQ
uniref:4-alpha-glucanotransferase n=1 Tax=Solanum tuberosum TaxID=4113 RepID=M1BDK8_SOLTU